MDMKKRITAREAAALIPDNARIVFGGFLGYGCPEEVIRAIRTSFEETGHPKDLTLLKGVSIGDKGERGINRLAAEGLLKCVICSHFGLEPDVAKMAAENKIFSYMLPLGTITDWLRTIASRKPGLITKTGLKTFVDPRIEGSKGNELTKEKGGDIVSLLEVDGEECLFYKTALLDACVIRGTYADEDGNISMTREAIHGEQLEIAAATHSSGGIVIVQVEKIVSKGSIDPRDVKIHGFMVDYIVVAEPENHPQTFTSNTYMPELTGDIRVPIDQFNSMPLNERKICGRRAALELKKDTLVNLGIGMPDAVAAVAAEEGIFSRFTLSIESGVLGGVPLGGLALGGSINPEAFYKMADILNVYDGGGLNMAVLGLAEMDEKGNLNVSKFNGKVVGPGGFINISQPTPFVIFTGTFTAGKSDIRVENGKLHIVKDGAVLKFKRQVEQITFSGEMATKNKQKVMVVTERAVFLWTKDGLMLTEYAPGVDVEKDIIGKMEFRPLISPDLKEMDTAIFRNERMGQERFMM